MGEGAGPWYGRQALRGRKRWPAFGLHPARNGSFERKGLCRVPVTAQAETHCRQVEEAGTANALMRIAFAGTPAFAAVALQALVESHFDLALVLTQPAPPPAPRLPASPTAVHHPPP